MLIGFFFHLRNAGLKVSIKELLTLIEALRAEVIGPSIDDFYLLARTILIKDESQYDKFDRAFGGYFAGVESVAGALREVPLDWLIKELERQLSDEQKANAKSLGGLDELMKRMKELLDEQKDKHAGGSKWIGTGGTSPFGHGGYNPEGIRIGGESEQRKAVKVWDQRAFRDYDENVELGTRNIKVALRKLRRFAREGAADELDLDGTITSTARNAGWLDLQMRPERHNAVKVLMLMDVGGTMDDHVRRTEELFSAARAEFKHMEFFYFHNCVYDFVWRHNRRRYDERTPTTELLHRFTPDYKLILVGDATMGPYEILQPHGSVEYSNLEPGAVWLNRLTATFPKFAWLNPEPEQLWQYRQSIDIVRQLMAGRMYPMTLDGLERAVRQLSR